MLRKSLVRKKLRYARSKEDLFDCYNWMAKNLNRDVPGEKLEILNDEKELEESMNKMALSLNGRKMLNRKLQYNNSNDDILSKFNWAVKVINSSKE